MNDRSPPRPENAMHPVHLSRKLFDDLGHFAALPGAEQRFLTAAWLLAPVISGALKRLGFQSALAKLPRKALHADGGVDIERGEALVRMAFRRHPLLAKGCLPESLTQYCVHALMGPAPKIVIGVKRSVDAAAGFSALDWSLNAHAWIERESGPAREPSFSPIISFSSRDGMWRGDGAGG